VSARRIYRVTATYPQGTATRHYLSRSGAEARAKLWREGRPYDPTLAEWERVPVLAPALTVTVEASDPITWPTPPTAPETS
jgi:hypothetical protein